MSENLETAKEIIRAYWHKVASDAALELLTDISLGRLTLREEKE